MRTAIFAIILTVPGGAAATPAATLRVALEQVAGAPVRLDPRIIVPECAQGWMITARATALDARCPGQGWSIVVPLANSDRGGETMVKRGSSVVVEAGSAGFSARIDAIAEQDGGVGAHVRVRNLRSGTRLVARVEGDGRLIANRR